MAFAGLGLGEAIQGIARTFHFDTMATGSWISGLVQQGLDNKNRKEQQDKQWESYEREFQREANWRNEDISLAQRWRDEDIERNSLANRMKEHQEQGLHPQLAVGSGGGDHATSPRTTGSGGRIPRPVSQGGTTGAPPQIMALGALAQIDNMMADSELKRAEAKEVAPTAEKEREKMQSQIISSGVTDKMNEQQTRLVKAQADRFIRDNRIIENGGEWILGETDTWDDLLVDLIRAGVSRENAEAFLRSLNIENINASSWFRNAEREALSNTGNVGRLMRSLNRKRQNLQALREGRNARGTGRGRY